jgi:hypothetical protein
MEPMPDELQHLRATLAEIDRLLDAGDSAEELRAFVAQALADVDAVSSESSLHKPAGSAGRREKPAGSLARRLAEGARHFENSHPTLFGSVGSVVDALSRRGI